MFVRRPGLDSRSPLEAIAKLYKLTATEVRVLQGVVETGGVPQIANELGLPIISRVARGCAGNTTGVPRNRLGPPAVPHLQSLTI